MTLFGFIEYTRFIIYCRYDLVARSCGDRERGVYLRVIFRYGLAHEKGKERANAGNDSFLFYVFQ